MKSHKWLIVTDLDGSLLGHHSYDLAEAVPVLRELATLQIPVIFNTSKTFKETLAIQADLALTAPFVIENGACICLPDGAGGFNKIIQGLRLQEIRDRLQQIVQQDDEFVALVDCSVEDLMGLTGLDKSSAQMALAREYSYPLIWKGSEASRQAFINRASQAGLNTLQGGRFLHLQGNTDKARAIEQLRVFYPDYQVACIGDSGNDLQMLLSADYSILIQSPGNQYLPEDFHADFTSTKPAPSGWAESVKHLMTQRDFIQETLHE